LKRIQEPSFPLEKEGPNRSRIVLASLFVGLFAGFAFVILRTLPDDVVRTRDDLERIEGLAVIGIMPRLDAKNLRRHVSLREQGW
jgi:capsular polysaccharide biosynthesis protein